MSNRDAYQKEQFEKAGVQAAKVLGRFMSIASEFATEMGRRAEEQNDRPDAAQRDSRADMLRETGEQLRQMREAAGYTLDRFVETLQKELNEPELNRTEVYGKVKAAESGSEALPGDWVKQVSDLLSSRDSTQFFERLQQFYEHSATPVEASNDEVEELAENPILQRRTARFTEIFTDDDELAEYTDEEFEKLLRFVKKNYHEARTLLLNK